jgi:outer membrane protein TolC
MGGNAMSGDRMGGGAMAGGSTFPDLLRVEAEGARLRADAVALDAMLEGEVRVLSRFVGDEAAAAVQSQPSAFLEGSSTPPPELDLAAAERSVAEANLRVARARLAPDLELRASVGVMPDGMVQGVNLMLGVELPVWGGQARVRDASAARLDAATRRADAVERDVAAAFDAARAAERAAAARATVLRDVAEPRADAAWQAGLARYAAGQGTVDEALRAWEGLLSVRRDRIAAERDERMRAAERARVETP